MMTIYDIEYIIKKFEPRTIEEFADFGLKIRAIGSGAYRRVYEIVGYGLVVKIPMNRESGYDFEDDKDSIEHAKLEWSAYKSLKKKKKYKSIKSFLPKIYACSKSGIVLMKKYERIVGKKKEINKRLKTLQHLLRNMFEGDECDAWWQNVALTKKGKLVLFDFGCFPRNT